MHIHQEHAHELQRYSERIERRLNLWVKRLEILIVAETQKLTPTDRQYFELWINEINICRNLLIRILANGGELHALINEQPPNWEKIYAKINEALGDNQHPGLRTLIALFQQLEQAEEKLGKFAREGAEKRIESIESVRKLKGF